MRVQGRDADEAPELGYRLLFESNPQPMWVYDPETLAFLAVNDAAVRQYGYSREEFLAMTLVDIRPTEDVARLVEDVAAQGSNPDWGQTWRHRTKSGDTLDVVVKAQPLVFAGRPARLVLAHDVTEARESAAALERSERWSRSLLEHGSDLIVVGGRVRGELQYVSPSVERILGYSPAEFRGVEHVGVLADDWLWVDQMVESLRAKPGAVSDPVTVRFVHRDGSIRFLDVVLSNLVDDPDVGGVIVNGREVTERQHAEERLREQSSILQSVINSIGEGIVVVGTDGRVLVRNPVAERLLGPASLTALRSSADAIVGVFETDRVTPLRPDRLPLALALRGESTDEVEIFVRNAHVPGGLYLENSGRPLLDESGRLRGGVTVFRDITARWHAAEALEEAARLALFAAEVGRAVTEEGSLGSMLGRCTDAMSEYFDTAFARVWTICDDGETLELQASSGTSEDVGGEHALVSVAQRGIGFIALERRLYLTNTVVGDPVVGEEGWAQQGGTSAFAGYPLVVDDRLVGVMALAARRSLSAGVTGALGSVAHEIALGIARKQSDEALLHQALHDSLTGLANRALLFNRIEQALMWTSRANTTVTVLFLDLDRFQLVNDSHGHPTGDAVLMEVARRLRAGARPTDTVGRFGGDEFVVVAETDPNDEIASVRLADRLLAAIRAPFEVDGRDLFLSASIGIATGTNLGSAAELLRDADAAMHQAKERGRSRVELFDEASRLHVEARLGVEGELRRALTRDELVVYYQPVVSLTTGTIVGAEALVRWRHPERGLVPPADFIPLAEEAGLIEPIGAWVLGQACGDAAGWQRTTTAVPFVSVNVSGIQLSAPGLPEVVGRALAASGLAPEHLTLEITETSLIRDLGTLTDSLLALKARGVRIAIDDFGTGYSSLTYLRRLPIDVVKVDKAFIDRLGISSEDSAILAAITTMGRSLGFQVVAEGVERSEQLSALRALSCDLGQGYFFAKPLPNDLFIDVLRLGRHW